MNYFTGLIKPSLTNQTKFGLESASDTLKADREVVLAAVKQCPWVLEFASEELQNDPELEKLAEG